MGGVAPAQGVSDHVLAGAVTVSGDPRDAPGAARERTMAVAELAELERLILTRSPSTWHHHSGVCLPCACWRCSALRIIRYGVR